MGSKAVVAAAALAIVCIYCGRPATLGSATGAVPGGAWVRVTRHASSPMYASFGGHSDLSRGIRYYYDPAGRVYSGYELQARSLGNGQFHVIVEGLGAPLSELLASHPEGYRSVPLPGLPAPRIVREGDCFEIDLRVDRGRLYDRVRVYGRAP